MPTWNRPHPAASTVPARLRQERGQALVEFAVVLPVLMLLILGILYFGRYESYSSQMTQLSEQGARDAAVDFSYPSSYTSLAAYIASQASGELAAGNGSTVAPLSVRVDCNSNVTSNPPTNCTAGDNVTVCMQSQVQFPGLNGVGAGTVSQSATMRVEQTSPTSNTASSGSDNYISDSISGSNPPSC